MDSIAVEYGVSVDSVIYNNQLVYPYRLAVGQALLLSSGNAGETVTSGADTGETDTSETDISETDTSEADTSGAGISGAGTSGANTSEADIGGDAGSEADSHSGSDSDRKEAVPLIHTGGYAYPFISPWVLEQTLPYLSELSIFSYGFTNEGEPVPPMLEEQWMIDAAAERRVMPTLTLTPIGEDGRFSDNLTHILVSDLSVQQNLSRRLLQIMLEKGYRGLNLDFEYVMAQDRLVYAQFVGNITRIMNWFGIPVSVALAPKYSDHQEGELYEGMDYGLLGAAANSVFLMTYEWGYTYGPPMAVAPIHLVRRVVEYALTRIPASKISLGMPNYGYDWALPYERGITKAKTIGNVEAVQLAIEQGVEIQFDEEAQSPYFRYWKYGVQHEVWFQDVRSSRAAFDLIKEFDLRGGGYWQLMQLFRANWLLLADTFEIEKMI